MRMATDYDAPRRTETDDVSEDSLEELKARRNEAQSAVVDVDESESAESFELPGADLSGEELSVRVIPKQADEFTCSPSCGAGTDGSAAGGGGLHTVASWTSGGRLNAITQTINVTTARATNSRIPGR